MNKAISRPYNLKASDESGCQCPRKANHPKKIDKVRRTIGELSLTAATSFAHKSRAMVTDRPS